MLPARVDTATGPAYTRRDSSASVGGRAARNLETSIGTVHLVGREVYYGFTAGGTLGHHLGTVPADVYFADRFAVRILGAYRELVAHEAAAAAIAEAARPAFVLPDGVDFLDFLLAPVPAA